MLRADSFRSKVEMLAQGISRFNISKGKVMEIEVPVPDKGEQALIGHLFLNLDSLITLHQREFSLPSCSIPIPLVPFIRRESPYMHYRGE